MENVVGIAPPGVGAFHLFLEEVMEAHERGTYMRSEVKMSQKVWKT